MVKLKRDKSLMTPDYFCLCKMGLLRAEKNRFFWEKISRSKIPDRRNRRVN